MRVVIADDEPLPRQKLRRVLEQLGATVVGECTNGEEAVDAIRRHRPDAAFVDIQMPLFDGLDVARKVADMRVKVVFVTAYDRHAIDAFDLGAHDYLLKPINPARVEASLTRLREQLTSGGPARTDDALATGRLLLRTDDRQIAVFVRDLKYIKAEGNYISYAVGDQHYLCRGTLASVQDVLSPRLFCRISRNTIVNVRWIREMEQFSPHGDCVLVLTDNTVLSVTRSYRRDLEALFLRPS